MITIALEVLSKFLSMRDQWVELAEGTNDPKYKGKCRKYANKRRLQGLVVHDRMLTGKRPL